jgi:methionyl-tRNA formyltransferase
MRIGVAATPDVAIPTLEWLLSSSHEIICVISQPDRPAGRGREISPGANGKSTACA